MEIITNPFPGYQLATVKIGAYTLTLRGQFASAQEIAAVETELVGAALRAAAALVEEQERAAYPLTVTVCCPETAQRLQQPRAGSLLARFGARRVVVAPRPAGDRDLARRYALYFEKQAAGQRWQR